MPAMLAMRRVRKVQAAAAARPEAKSNKKLPEFHAEESTLSASLWLVDCEHTKGYNNWSDQQTLDAMILALKGKALSWRETLTLAESPNLQRLDLFITAFTERFIPNKTVLQCVSAVSDLKQKNNEAIRDYYDRVQRGILLSLDSVRRTCTVGEKPGFDKCVQHFIKIHFIFGLRTNIKSDC